VDRSGRPTTPGGAPGFAQFRPATGMQTAPDDRSRVEDWSRGLDPREGFGRYLACLAEAAFALPVPGQIGNVRAFSLPDRISVMTMRSFTAFEEEDSSSDDGT
jgi:hypothetical protein